MTGWAVYEEESSAGMTFSSEDGLCQACRGTRLIRDNLAGGGRKYGSSAVGSSDETSWSRRCQRMRLKLLRAIMISKLPGLEFKDDRARWR